MSILSFSSQCTSITSAGFSINVFAKKDQSQKKVHKSSNASTTRRDPVGFERQLKKGPPPPTQEGFVSDAVPVERITTTTKTLRSAARATTTDDGGPDQKENVGDTNDKLLVADRGSVLKACIGTSVGLSLAGFLLRQASHSGAEVGWQVPDCTALLPYRTELWHSIPTVGVVVLVTSLRQILLQVWPEFAQSSEVANNQVLRSLKTVDIFTVSYLSGISEELLFRGALLPILGADWKGVLGAGLIFGVLHLSGGRNASFAVWASFVGVVYGILGLYTSDLAAPMAAHSAANLLGAAIWKMSQNDEESNRM